MLFRSRDTRVHSFAARGDPEVCASAHISPPSNMPNIWASIRLGPARPLICGARRPANISFGCGWLGTLATTKHDATSPHTGGRYVFGRLCGALRTLFRLSSIFEPLAARDTRVRSFAARDDPEVCASAHISLPSNMPNIWASVRLGLARPLICGAWRPANISFGWLAGYPHYHQTRCDLPSYRRSLRVREVVRGAQDPVSAKPQDSSPWQPLCEW